MTEAWTQRTFLLLGAVLASLTLAQLALAEDRIVRVYNWSDYIDEAVLKEFTQETGIRVQYDVFDSNDALETKLLAGKTGYDVVVPSANFLARQIKAGVFMKLDKSKIPNLTHMWEKITKPLSTYDPGNTYAVNYMWGTTGIGYNVKMIKARMPDAPVDSWRMIFDPEVIKKFADCGVMLLDASDEIMTATLNYLGLDPDSKDPEDFAKAVAHFKKIRPYVRKFHSSEYINALANGDVCLVIGWSGDVIQARDRADEKNENIADENQKVDIAYTIPKEGALMWFDSMAIPKDAPHPDEAHAFINFMNKPEVAARNTNYVGYPSGNLASQTYIDEAVLKDPQIYPDKATTEKLFTTTPYDPKAQRALLKSWRQMKRR